MSVIKSYSKKELAGLYNVSTKTLNKWLQPINSKIGQYTGKSFCLKQVKIIFEHLGEPEQ